MSDVAPDPAEARWRSALDDLEAALARQRAALASGDHGDATAFARLAFTPPADLPPIPVALVERARRLRLETDELIERTRAAVEGLAPIGSSHNTQHGRHAGRLGARRPAARFDRRV